MTILSVLFRIGNKITFLREDKKSKLLKKTFSKNLQVEQFVELVFQLNLIKRGWKVILYLIKLQ